MSSRGLQIESVWFAVREKVIVRDVSLDVAPGETLAVVGPSGCGKTTLLRLVAGLEQPTRGRIQFAGAAITGMPSHRRGFGMMFQDFGLFPHLDVAGNVGYGLRRGHGSRQERVNRVGELLELVGLSGYERRSVGTLSGGERQRVALARALAPEPRMLMLDEPLGSLDRGLRQRLLVEVKAILGKLRIPAIYVTHDQYEAFAIADRMAIMREGAVVRTGEPKAVYNDPQTEFVARFLGLENIIDGSRRADGLVETEAGTWRVEPGESEPVRVLLREEGVSVASEDGEGVLTGVLEAGLFQGASTRVRVAAAGESLEFALPDDRGLPGEGEVIRLRIPGVQIVDGSRCGEMD
ncbi:MAG: ABC transporter ATP-binding protein [Dehalococcoidia bacterium]|nr:ABC transporter ATP-binding protein [Dehalococcoidia bacterium]